MKKLFILLMVLCLIGCEKMSDENGLSVFIKEQDVEPLTLVKDESNLALLSLKNHLLMLEKINDVVIIAGEDDVLIAYRVEQFARLHMKKVEKEVKEDAQDFLKTNKEIIVSSDYKIFLEAVRLHNKLGDESYLEEANERLKSIIKLQKEMT